MFPICFTVSNLHMFRIHNFGFQSNPCFESFLVFPIYIYVSNLKLVFPMYLFCFQSILMFPNYVLCFQSTFNDSYRFWCFQSMFPICVLAINQLVNLQISRLVLSSMLVQGVSTILPILFIPLIMRRFRLWKWMIQNIFLWHRVDDGTTDLPENDNFAEVGKQNIDPAGNAAVTVSPWKIHWHAEKMDHLVTLLITKLLWIESTIKFQSVETSIIWPSLFVKTSLACI